MDGWRDGWKYGCIKGYIKISLVDMWTFELDGWNSDGLNGYEQTTSLTFKHL